MKDQILAKLSEAYPWKDQFHWFDTIGSTNDELKVMARNGAPHGTVLVAGHQTGGRGRMGRTFQSPAGMGVYLSVLLRPECSAEELMHLTCATAVAMCDAVEASTGLTPGIKWTNDLVFGKRKLGGILTELGFGPKGNVDYAIVGVGMNCCQKESDFPPEIRDIAASLEMVLCVPVDRAAVAAAMMESLHQMSLELGTCKEEMLRRYRSSCITLGQQVSILRGDEIRHADALDVDDCGALVVAYPDGTVEAVNSGEVSVRGMYGYI